MNTRFNLIILIFCTCIFGCTDSELKEKAFLQANEVIENLDSIKSYAYFPKKYFSKEQIESISLDLRERCDYKNGVGKFVDYYYESMPSTDKVSFIYEYFLECDSIRFILKYDLKPEPELILFHFEGIEVENPIIIDKSKQLLPHSGARL